MDLSGKASVAIKNEPKTDEQHQRKKKKAIGKEEKYLTHNPSRKQLGLYHLNSVENARIPYRWTLNYDYIAKRRDCGKNKLQKKKKKKTLKKTDEGLNYKKLGALYWFGLWVMVVGFVHLCPQLLDCDAIIKV
uniref:Uncharacterized protein n=1 Tax=Glossina brevipalpis TaxID=37001 RepID=A0A1A9WBK0_9MUSC